VPTSDYRYRDLPKSVVSGELLQILKLLRLRAFRGGSLQIRDTSQLECSQNVPVSAAHDCGADSISFHSQSPDIPTPKLLQVRPNPLAAARLRALHFPAPFLPRIYTDSFLFRSYSLARCSDYLFVVL
jgi:hypothetical protein